MIQLRCFKAGEATHRLSFFTREAVSNHAGKWFQPYGKAGFAFTPNAAPASACFKRYGFFVNIISISY